jgi:diguanylate cyclase (GGDEF)-like protein
MAIAAPGRAQRVAPSAVDARTDSALELRLALSERQRAVESLKHAEAEQALAQDLDEWKRNSVAGFAVLLALVGWIVQRQRARQGELEEELRMSDPLTGARNRRFIQQIMPAEASGMARRHRTAAPGASIADSDIVFFLIDIDQFRRINDVHGHAAGDRVLGQVARQLMATLRDSDEVARWGGEEFLVVSRLTNRERAGELAERLRGKLEAMQTALPDGSLVSVTCSIGFAAFPFSRSSPESVGWEGVVALAHVACYAAKRDGRNAWATFRAARSNERDVPLRDVTISDIDARVLDGTVMLEGSRDFAVEPRA